MNGKHIIGHKPKQPRAFKMFPPTIYGTRRPPSPRHWESVCLKGGGGAYPEKQSVMKLCMYDLCLFNFFPATALSPSALFLQLGLQIQLQRLRHPYAAEVPPESEEPGDGRLPPQQATLLLGVAQLSPVSLMSCQHCPPQHHHSGCIICCSQSGRTPANRH